MYKSYTYEFRKSTVLKGITIKSLEVFIARRKITMRTYYRWLSQYNKLGIEGLKDKSRKPHSHPKMLPKELNYYVLKYHKEGKGQLFISHLISIDKNIKQTISKTGVRNILIRTNAIEKRKRERKKKEYMQYVKNCIKYPGQKGQIDVKYIKELPGESFKRKQYTYIDLFTRFTYRKVYENISAENSKHFLNEVIKNVDFNIECIQTDWGIEFTYGMLGYVKKAHPFEEELKKHNINRKLIPVATPRMNGSVESVHSRDQAEFYDKYLFKSSVDLENAIKERNYFWNYQRLHSSLGYKTPSFFLRSL
jgi:hypothetical protein